MPENSREIPPKHAPTAANGVLGWPLSLPEDGGHSSSDRLDSNRRRLNIVSTRGDELRKKQNKILAWSLAFAAVFHAALFLLWPTMTVEPLPVTDTPIQAAVPIVGPRSWLTSISAPPGSSSRMGQFLWNHRNGSSKPAESLAFRPVVKTSSVRDGLRPGAG